LEVSEKEAIKRKVYQRLLKNLH